MGEPLYTLYKHLYIHPSMLLHPLPSSPLVPKLAADRIGILDTPPPPAQALRVSMYHRERFLYLEDFLFQTPTSSCTLLAGIAQGMFVLMKGDYFDGIPVPDIY